MLFSKQGYKATTMRELAEKTGLSAGSLYNYIKSKEDLLLDIQTKFIDEMLGSIKEYGGRVSAAEKLENACEAIIRAIARDQLAWKILIDQFHLFPNSQQRKMKVKADELENLIIGIIEEGSRAGEFSNVDSKFAALFFMGACHHVSKWLRPKGKLSPQEIAKQFSSYVLHGLCKKDRNVA